MKALRYLKCVTAAVSLAALLAGCSGISGLTAEHRTDSASSEAGSSAASGAVSSGKPNGNGGLSEEESSAESSAAEAALPSAVSDAENAGESGADHADPAGGNGSGDSRDTDPGDGADSSASADAVGTFSVASPDNLFAVDIPNTWQNMRGQLDDAGNEFPIEVGSYDAQSFLLVSWELKNGSPFASLDEFYQRLVQEVTGSRYFANVEIDAPETWQFGESGLTGRKVLFTADYYPGGAPAAPTAAARSGGASGTDAAESTGTSAGDAADAQKIAYRIYVAEDSVSYYQFCCWTTAANAAVNGEEFDRIVDSFHHL